MTTKEIQRARVEKHAKRIRDIISETPLQAPELIKLTTDTIYGYYDVTKELQAMVKRHFPGM